MRQKPKTTINETLGVIAVSLTLCISAYAVHETYTAPVPHNDFIKCRLMSAKVDNYGVQAHLNLIPEKKYLKALKEFNDECNNTTEVLETVQEKHLEEELNITQEELQKYSETVQEVQKELNENTIPEHEMMDVDFPSQKEILDFGNTEMPPMHIYECDSLALRSTPESSRVHR